MNKKFEIKNIYIKNVLYGDLNCSMEGVTHKKILTTLSIVQAYKGSYDIALDNLPQTSLCEGDVFIAPANVMQKITHHDNSNGIMQAHWVFIDAVINYEYHLDDFFNFPVSLDKSLNEVIFKHIKIIGETTNYFEKIKSAYSLLEILVNAGMPKTKTSPVKERLENFVFKNYSLNIKAQDIAKTLYCSIPQVFRYTQKFFGETPANYVNGVRLQHAEQKLIYTALPITDVALSVGFDDVSYFSKLFKKHYGYSPINYRKKYAI